MKTDPNRKTGHRTRREREAKRLTRDRKIFANLRLLAAQSERRHNQFDEKIDPLSVYMGKAHRPGSWELSPFPVKRQDNGKPMPQWKDLSQWMKLQLATIVCHEWDLLTFNINLHPELEAELVARGEVRTALSERVRKHLGRVVTSGREYFFMIEAHAKGTGAATHIHMHGAIATYDRNEREIIKNALAKATGHDINGRKRVPRAVHSAWFTEIQAAYGNYLFKFARRADPRLDEKRLVMSRSMTQAAQLFWEDITGKSFG